MKFNREKSNQENTIEILTEISVRSSPESAQAIKGQKRLAMCYDTAYINFTYSRDYLSPTVHCCMYG